MVSLFQGMPRRKLTKTVIKLTKLKQGENIKGDKGKATSNIQENIFKNII